MLRLILLKMLVFRFNRFVQPICIDLSKGEELPVNSECVITGWGVTNTTTKEHANILQVATVNKTLYINNINKFLSNHFSNSIYFNQK